MLVGKILQQKYHIVAQINSNELRKTYIALEQSTAAHPEKYIIRHFSPPSHNAAAISASRLQIATQLQHLNGISDRIPKLFQSWLQHNHLFLVFEYIDSQCLSQEFITTQSWPEQIVISLLAELMAILQPLHQQQIGHGNLHLQQFLRRTKDQKITLTDVGITPLVHCQQIENPVAIAQDLQAIGRIAIQALTGRDIDRLTVDRGNNRWQQCAPNCSPEFAAIIDRLLTADPTWRWPSILPATIALEKIIRSNPVLQLTTTPIESSLECAIAQIKTMYSDTVTEHNNLLPPSLEAEIEALKMQADQKFIQGDAEGAIADYDQIISLDPQPMYYHNRGIIYAYALGNYQQALQDHTTTITLKPDFANAYQNRAFSQRMLGNLTAAIEDYSHSLELLPNTAIIYWDRGLVYQQLGNLPAALADYTQFLAYQPYHAEAYHQRGNIQQKLGNLPAAAADYDRSIELNPFLALTYYDRGGLQAQENNFSGAIADYSKAIELDPQLVIAYNNRGIIKRRQGDLVGAIADYSDGLQIDANSLDCLRNRGIAREQLKDYTGALADFQRAANMYLQQGQHGEYEKILKVVEILQRYDRLQD